MRTLITSVTIISTVCCWVVSVAATTLVADQFSIWNGKYTVQTRSYMYRVSQRGCEKVPDHYRQEEYGVVLHALEIPCP